MFVCLQFVNFQRRIDKSSVNLKSRSSHRCPCSYLTQNMTPETHAIQLEVVTFSSSLKLRSVFLVPSPNKIYRVFGNSYYKPLGLIEGLSR